MLLGSRSEAYEKLLGTIERQKEEVKEQKSIRIEARIALIKTERKLAEDREKLGKKIIKLKDDRDRTCLH